MLLKDSADPRPMMSSTDTDEPNLAMLHTENAEPMRALARNDTDEPSIK
jgi:hypothetical protein